MRARGWHSDGGQGGRWSAYGVVLLAAALLCGAIPAAAQVGAEAEAIALLSPPPADGPVVVRARFALRDVNDIDDDAETFEFSGVLALTWRDPRQGFDPQAAGVAEKFYQGEFQFNEMSPAWYPQVVLANESGMYDKHGVLLRVRPDGTQTLIETVNAIAEVDLDLRRFPFDVQVLEAVFEVLGFDDEEVRLEVEAVVADAIEEEIQIPQWRLAAVDASIRTRSSPGLGAERAVSQLVLRIEVERQSFFILRLVVFPLALIVALSWSVFWMDRSSLGDRISVSFVGILTAVAYQLIVADLLPNVSYFSLMHTFLNLSFLLMCCTVLVNLIVGACDKAGRQELGDAVDRRCRWIFPLVYGGLLLASGVFASVYF